MNALFKYWHLLIANEGLNVIKWNLANYCNCTIFSKTSAATDLLCGDLKPIQGTAVEHRSSDDGQGPPTSSSITFLPRTHKQVLPFTNSYREQGRIPDIERSEILADTYYSHIDAHLLSELRSAFSRQMPSVVLVGNADYKIKVKSAGTTIRLKDDATVLSMHFSIVAYTVAPKDHIWLRMCTISESGLLPKEEGSAYAVKLADDLVKEISKIINSNQEVLK